MTTTHPLTEVREHLIAALHADLVGPFLPATEDGEEAEEVLKLSPSRWYLTGFLAPPAEASSKPRTAAKTHGGSLAGSLLAGCTSLTPLELVGPIVATSWSSASAHRGSQDLSSPDDRPLAADLVEHQRATRRGWRRGP